MIPSLEGIEEVRACKTGRNGERGESGKERKREEGDRMMEGEGETERKERGKEGFEIDLAAPHEARER